MNQRESHCTNEELARQAVDFGADIVGLGSLTPSGHGFAPLTRMVREGLPGALIVLGGPHVSSFRAKAMADTAANAAVTEEGELAFEQVIRTYFDGGDFGQIPGLIWRNADGEVLTNPGKLPSIDMDSLPFPAYDLIDLPKYLAAAIHATAAVAALCVAGEQPGLPLSLQLLPRDVSASSSACIRRSGSWTKSSISSRSTG